MVFLEQSPPSGSSEQFGGLELVPLGSLGVHLENHWVGG